jgi:phosphoribosylamine---glycine ligase
MKVFVIGSGGREHAQTWALAQSRQVKQIFSATTNAGIQRLSTPAAIDASKPEAIAAFAVQEQIDLVVVGPEQPLVDGVVDALAAHGIAAFGPCQAAARLEGSKVFAKEFMARHRIPTARYQVVCGYQGGWLGGGQGRGCRNG